MTTLLSLRAGSSGPAFVGNADGDTLLWDNTAKKFYVGPGGGVGAVASVFGRVGAVVAATGDYDSDQVDNLSNVPGASVSDALDALAVSASVPPRTRDFLVDAGTAVAPADQDGSEEKPFSTLAAAAAALAAAPSSRGSLRFVPGDYTTALPTVLAGPPLALKKDAGVGCWPQLGFAAPDSVLLGPITRSSSAPLTLIGVEIVGAFNVAGGGLLLAQDCKLGVVGGPAGSVEMERCIVSQINAAGDVLLDRVRFDGADPFFVSNTGPGGVVRMLNCILPNAPGTGIALNNGELQLDPFSYHQWNELSFVRQLTGGPLIAQFPPTSGTRLGGDLPDAAANLGVSPGNTWIIPIERLTGNRIYTGVTLGAAANDVLIVERYDDSPNTATFRNGGPGAGDTLILANRGYVFRFDGTNWVFASVGTRYVVP